MKSRLVSITGATGFVGWHAAETFRDAGWHVRAIVRPGSPNPLPPGIERVTARLDAVELTQACAGSDVVVHSAGLVRAAGVEPFRRTNVDGTRAAVAAANAAGARLVHISSLAAIGPSAPGRPNQEDDPPHPVTPYGRSKWDSEEVVRTGATVPWTILRPGSVYGPRDREFLALFKLGARGRFLLATQPGARFTLVHVDDVSRAVLAAAVAQAGVGGAFFVGHPDSADAATVLQAVAAAVGRPYKPINVPHVLLKALAALGEIGWRVGMKPTFDRSRLAEFEAGSFVCAVDRARDCLGFVAAVPLREGMAATYRWYLKERWL